MMENHSFDNMFGALSLTRSEVEGLTFANGLATNENPGGPATANPVVSFPLKNTQQGLDVSQSWKDSHEQINGGAMNGFVRSTNSEQPMGYFTPAVLPFAYSLAANFTLADQWFCSLPGPTYPNRRFLLAGTAYGCTATDNNSLLDPEPPGGTVFDLLSNHHVSWADYFSDVPMSMVIARSMLRHLGHHHPIEKFFSDCKAGNLPAVSFVDPKIGILSKIGRPIAQLPFPFDDALKTLGARLAADDQPETEEDPQDLYYGELWAQSVIQAVIDSPLWPQTCLIYLYDEHGGYFDHYRPPSAVAPDNIAPVLAPGDPVAGYTQYGPRVPAIIVSPYSRAGGITSVVHDHTSVLRTIEEKWNLPALTRRDANAETIIDFLDPSQEPLERPILADPIPPAAALAVSDGPV